MKYSIEFLGQSKNDIFFLTVDRHYTISDKELLSSELLVHLAALI